MKGKYEDIASILRGESYGCVNIGNHDEFEEISNSIVGFACFGKVVFNALLEQLAKRVREMRQEGLVNEDYSGFSIFCRDKDYMVALNLASILFPSVVSYCIYDEGCLKELDSIYRFRKLNELDINEIAGMFSDEVSENIRLHLSSLDGLEEATESVINGNFIIPF